MFLKIIMTSKGSKAGTAHFLGKSGGSFWKASVQQGAPAPIIQASVDGKAAYETSKHVSGVAYNTAGQGLQAGWKMTKDVASKPEVQKAAIIGAGAVGVVGVATAGLPLLGFTTAGVKGGTIAATWQSSIGNVVAGSAFAKLTSAGAAGMAFSTKTLLGTAGGYLSSKLFNSKEDK